MTEIEWVKDIRRLPRGIAPQRDLWPGIDRRLGASRHFGGLQANSSPWRAPALVAALALALVTGLMLGRRDVVKPVAEAAPTVLQYALEGAVEASEKEYQAAFLQLAPVRFPDTDLTDKHLVALRGAWEDLRRTENSLLGALHQYPANLYLNETLLHLRARQLQFIKRLALLQENNWRSA